MVANLSIFQPLYSPSGDLFAISFALLRFIETSQYVDEFEMEEIKNRELQESLRRALQDARKRRGRFVE